MKKSKNNEHVQHVTPAAVAKFELLPAPVAPGHPDPDRCELPTLTGYALVWNVPSSDDRRIVVRRGAVTFTSPVLAYYNHDTSDVIGSTANGTLRMTSDDYGLRVEIDPPDTQPGRDVCELVGKKFVSGMSFGCFELKKHKEGDTTVYDLIQVDEVSVVARPAFTETSITVVGGSVDDSVDDSLDDDSIQGYAAAEAHLLKLEELRFQEMELTV